MRISCALVALGLAFAPGLASGGPEQDALRLRAGAQGKLCRDCHVEFAKEKSQAHLHPLVAKDECTNCHDAHVSDHGKLLARSPATLCAGCHTVPAAGDTRVHAPVREEGCGVCHDAHGSPNPGVLLKPARELCGSCHQPVLKAAIAAKFKHEPVLEESCTKSCHRPHGSSVPGALLSKDVQALCLECHDPKKKGFAARHGGYSVVDASCVGCHDPHGSNRRGMLLDVVHEPVAKGKCGECHAPPAAAVTTLAAGPALCERCHRDAMEEMRAVRRVHSAIREGDACLNCHTAHASRRPKLVDPDLDATCGRCHADTLARHARSPTKHGPIGTGECNVCHLPHGGDRPLALVTEDNLELCGKCHEWQKHSSHPIGPKYRDPRNPNLSLDCLSCHRAHGTEHKHLMPFAAASLMCTQCHQRYRD